MQITFKNSFVEICVELEPFFRIESFTDLKTGKNMLSTGTPKFVADRETLADYRLTASVQTPQGWDFSWKIGPVTLTRHCFFRRNAPALRWYDTFETETDLAAVCYSTLVNARFHTDAHDAEVINFYSCSDQSNHRMIKAPAKPGKNSGAYFTGNGMFLYKEGPMPDSQPIPCEYDFLYSPEANAVEMLGLGFDNLRKGEPRRANGVVLGLTRDFGLQRYWLERYPDYPESAATEVLANSWPDLTLGVTEEAITKELHAAAKAGVNVVFIDDGWFSAFMGNRRNQVPE